MEYPSCWQDWQWWCYQGGRLWAGWGHIQFRVLQTGQVWGQCQAAFQVDGFGELAGGNVFTEEWCGVPLLAIHKIKLLVSMISYVSPIVAVVFWCNLLGGILCWQDSLWWSGPTHNDPTTGEWKKARQTLKYSLLRGNVSYPCNTSLIIASS